MKIRLAGAELFHVDRQIDRYDEANSGFSQFRKKAYKNIATYNCRTARKVVTLVNPCIVI
jgi:hypothetical protein